MNCESVSASKTQATGFPMEMLLAFGKRPKTMAAESTKDTAKTSSRDNNSISQGFMAIL